MPHSVRFEGRKITVSFTGLVTGEGLLDYAAEVAGDPRFDDVCHSLHDYSQCTGVACADDAIEELAAFATAATTNKRSCRPYKIAIVSTRVDVDATVHAFIRLGIFPFGVRVFADAADAQAWLDDPADDVWPSLPAHFIRH
jgi:hypothetical protein